MTDSNKKVFKRLKGSLLLLTAAAVIGALSGIVGAAFHKCVDFVTLLRVENSVLILFLPIGGIVIALLYAAQKNKGQLTTGRVLQAAAGDENVPAVMLPLIFLGTTVSHLFGASVGREGAALQLGGSMGYNAGRLCGFSGEKLHIIVMAGMSGVFSALFGTPLTAAVFVAEAALGGKRCAKPLVFIVISSIVARIVSSQLGVLPVKYSIEILPEYSLKAVCSAAILAVVCAVVCMAFSHALKKTELLLEKAFPSGWIRAMVGGIIIVILTLILNTTHYNGAGMEVISGAMAGDVIPFAFLLKIVFTAVSVGAGFKGGEIVPSFFVGATLGAAMGGFLGIPAGFSASLGFIAVFCGMVNCPVASFILAAEVFGIKKLPLYALVVFITYIASGKGGLYKGTK